MEQATAKLSLVLERLDSLGVDPRRLSAIDNFRSKHRGHAPLVFFFAGVAMVTVAVGYELQLFTYAGLSRSLLKWWGYDLYNERCVLGFPERLMNWVRPMEDCAMCRGLKEVDFVSNISPKEFEESYWRTNPHEDTTVTGEIQSIYWTSTITTVVGPPTRSLTGQLLKNCHNFFKRAQEEKL